MPKSVGYWWAKYEGNGPFVYHIVSTFYDPLAVQDDGERLEAYWDNAGSLKYEWICKIPTPAELVKLAELNAALKLFAKSGINTTCDQGRLSFERRWDDEGTPCIESVMIESDGTIDYTRFRDGKVLDIDADIAKAMQAVYEEKLTKLRRDNETFRATFTTHEQDMADFEARCKELDAAREELTTLRAGIDKLPRTEDNHPIILGQNIYAVVDSLHDGNPEVVECGFLTMTVDGDYEGGTVRSGDGEEYDVLFSDVYHVEENAKAAIAARKALPNAT